MLWFLPASGPVQTLLYHSRPSAPSRAKLPSAVCGTLSVSGAQPCPGPRGAQRLLFPSRLLLPELPQRLPSWELLSKSGVKYWRLNSNQKLKKLETLLPLVNCSTPFARQTVHVISDV